MWTKLELPQMHIETKNYTYFLWGKLKNVNFAIFAIISSHLPSMVNNIGLFLVAIKTQRKIDFSTFNFIWQALQWTSPNGEMMISTQWQFWHT